MKKSLYWLVLIFLLAANAWLFSYTTEHGVGLTNDSSAYIGGARSILAGNGYSRLGGDKLPRPITQFPPMYSLVLAGAAKLTGTDPLEAALLVNLVCSLCAMAFLVSFIRKAAKSELAAIFGGIAYLCCAPILQAEVYGLSEALFMPLLLLLLNLAFDAGSEDKNGICWLFIGLLSGVLMLVRYAGAAAFAAVLIYSMCALSGWKNRLRSALLDLIGFLLPLAIWLLRNRSLDVGGLNRSGSYHLPGMDKIYEGIEHFAGFFLPEFGGLVQNYLRAWGLVITLVLSALLAWTLVQLLRALFGKTQAASGAFLPSLSAITYLGLLIFTAIFIDGSTVFDDRMLLPFYLLSILLIFILCGKLFNNKHRVSSIIAILIMVAFPLLLLEDDLDQIREYHEDGQGFAGSEWVDSEIRQAAAEIEAEMEIFSNRQTFLWLMNDQPSFIIPPLYNAANAADRENFEAERQWMYDEVMSGKACVVVFNYDELMTDEGDKAWLDVVLKGLPVAETCQDGVIFCLQ